MSTLTTNGKAEPVEWSAIRAEAAGRVERILVERGQAVARGQLLVQLDPGAARAAVGGAEARIAQSQANLEVLEQGGSARELAEIESGVASAQAQLAQARSQADALGRLAGKNAATRAEADLARQAVEKWELEIQALERRRVALASREDRRGAEAQLREAESGAASARIALGTSQIRSPLAGVLYALDVKPGSYVNPGDPVGSVGRLDQMRVSVYVDEPELGRVSIGMPATITWDALPGREWKGTVSKLPTQIFSLGTRQVGEVVVIVGNPDQSLIPGTNVNTDIRSAVVERALTIPREALRREGNQTGVLKLEGERVTWQPITLGVSSVTRIQVAGGLNEGDAVALPTDAALKAGDAVRPVFR